MRTAWRDRRSVTALGLMATCALTLGACDLTPPAPGGTDPLAPAGSAGDPAVLAPEPSPERQDGAGRGGLTFESTFEDGDLDEWAVSQQACEYSNEIVTDVVRAGTRADRFEMRPEDAQGCPSYRGEGSDAYGGAKSDLRADAPQQQTGEYHYGFSIFLPEGFATSVGDAKTLLWQIHAGSARGGRPSMALTAEGGQLHLNSSTSGGGCSGEQPGPSQALGPIVEGQWTDYVVSLDLDLGGANDRVELLTRGPGESAYQPVAVLQGSIGYCDIGPSRIGIYNPRYRSAIEKHNGPTVVYFDEYREGTSQAAVETPAGGGTPG